MTKLLVVCLGVILSLPATEAFTPAERIGHLPRALFRFETSAGKYTIRSDGFVEIYAYQRKRVFYLSMPPKGRLERVYFIAHEGDLLLRYDVIDQGTYLTRIEQTPSGRLGGRKRKWVTELPNQPDQVPVIDGDLVIVSHNIIVHKDSGSIVRQD